MTRKFWDKKIPTAVGMILIIAGLSITTLLTNQQTFFGVGAQVNTQPQDVRITNITDNSFTVSYTTNVPTSGFINYGQNSLDQTSFSDLAQSQKLESQSMHIFTVKNLSPETEYNFVITSGQDKYLNNGKNFKVTTAKSVQSGDLFNQISGKVILPDSNPPKEAIVYLTVDGAQTLSTTVDGGGNYKINLNHLLNQSLTSLVNLSKNSELKILILGDTLISSATIYYQQAENIPLITLSNNYDFRYQEEKIASASANLDSFPSVNTITKTTKKGGSLKILTPESNQILDSQKPDIKGTALPNQEVKIQIHSDQKIEATVSTDSNGNWVYQPTTKLDPGTHTIIVSTKDSSGIVNTITKSFTVYAQEITPTPVPSLTPTPTPFEETTISPTPQPLPVVGNTSIIAAGIAGLLISVVGGLIFFLSHKIS